ISHGEGNGTIFPPGAFRAPTPTPTPTQNPLVLPFVSISPTTVTASPSGTTIAIFTVDLSVRFNNTVVVYYATADDTATASDDYVPIPATPLAFLPGEISKTITVAITPEPRSAAAKTFTVNLSSPTNAFIGIGQAS